MSVRVKVSFTGVGITALTNADAVSELKCFCRSNYDEEG